MSYACGLLRTYQCAVQRHEFSAGLVPSGKGSLQPVATGAMVEVTKLSEPSVKRVVKRLGEHAGRNVQ